MYGVADETRLLIPEGVRGVSATLALMRQCAEAGKSSPLIRQTALQILRTVPEHDDRAEVAALCEWVRDKIRYTRDVYGVETLHTPERILDLRQGDCDDKSCLLAALLMSVGYPVEFAVMRYQPGNSYDHVCVAALLPRAGEVVLLETTEQVAPGEIVPGVLEIAFESTL